MKATQRWECPNCGYAYSSPIELDYAPTHQCKENVKRIYEMKLAEDTCTN